LNKNRVRPRSPLSTLRFATVADFSARMCRSRAVRIRRPYISNRVTKGDKAGVGSRNKARATCSAAHERAPPASRKSSGDGTDLPGGLQARLETLWGLCRMYRDHPADGGESLCGQIVQFRRRPWTSSAHEARQFLHAGKPPPGYTHKLQRTNHPMEYRDTVRRVKKLKDRRARSTSHGACPRAGNVFAVHGTGQPRARWCNCPHGSTAEKKEHLIADSRGRARFAPTSTFRRRINARAPTPKVKEKASGPGENHHRRDRFEKRPSVFRRTCGRRREDHHSNTWNRPAAWGR